MGKNKTNLVFYYDEDFDEVNRPKRSYKPKKKSPGLVFDDSNLKEYNDKKQKAKDRRANKRKDKDKYDKYDEWN